MNNENIGKFISAIRKEKQMSQKELAKKLNITDKAISKWETGKGAPDVSNLIPLADILEVSVTEILNGKRIINDVKEENKAVVQAIKSTEKTGKKNTIKAIISVVLILAVIISTVYIGWFAYWGRRHLVLYEIDTVYLTQIDTPQEVGYRYDVEVTAHNWLINPFSMYSYDLRPYIGGEQEFGYNGGTSGNVTIKGLKETTFKLEGMLYTALDEQTAMNNFLQLSFTPQDSELTALSLYMQDHQDVKFVFR